MIDNNEDLELLPFCLVHTSKEADKAALLLAAYTQEHNFIWSGIASFMQDATDAENSIP